MAKKILAYTHPPIEPSTQQPDDAPGNYYVSIKDGKKFGLLVGPFVNDHAAALVAVVRARAKAEEVDPWAAFASVGTVRMPGSYTIPGVINDLLSDGDVETA